jgi:hypothetical protein
MDTPSQKSLAQNIGEVALMYLGSVFVLLAILFILFLIMFLIGGGDL